MKATRRAKRVRTLERTGGKVGLLYRQCVNSTLLWGSAVNGIPSSTLRTMTYVAAKATGKLRRGQSASLACRLRAGPKGHSSTDPAMSYCPLLMLHWATSIWTAQPPLEVCQAAMDSAFKRLGTATRPWSIAWGPADAFVLALQDLEWAAIDARHLVMHTGDDLTFSNLLPSSRQAG